MHLNSYGLMDYLRIKYAPTAGKVLEVGSKNINGSYRALFKGYEYIGIDIEPGKGVDFVMPPYTIEFPDRAFDMVICGSVLEHCEFPWMLVQEIARVLRIGGVALIIAPSVWELHRYPIDCYRFLPDGFRALAKYARLHCDTAGVSGKGKHIDCYMALSKRV